MAFGQTVSNCIGFLGRCPRLRCKEAFGQKAAPSFLKMRNFRTYASR